MTDWPRYRSMPGKINRHRRAPVARATGWRGDRDAVFRGLTAEEIATAVGWPVHVVRDQVRFARAWLRRGLLTGEPRRLPVAPRINSISSRLLRRVGVMMTLPLILRGLQSRGPAPFRTGIGGPPLDRGHCDDARFVGGGRRDRYRAPCCDALRSDAARQGARHAFYLRSSTLSRRFCVRISRTA
jgi:hypothetical protein